MSQRFSGQVALVAGGTGALGRAVSIAFLEEGATIADKTNSTIEPRGMCQCLTIAREQR